MTSAIRRLLDEVSWEGNASKYRDGGLGKENVLTAEVQLINERLGKNVPMCDPLATVAYATWADLADMAMRVSETYSNDDDSALRAIRRIATSLSDAVAAHS